MFNKILLFFVQITDPFLLLPQQVTYRIEQEENLWVNRMAIINHTLWASGFILLFFLSDYNKPDVKIWAIYRFGLALSIILLGIISFLFRKKTSIVVINLYLVALLISLAVSWSMSFHNVNGIRSKWVVMISACVLISVVRSLIVPICWLLFSIAVSSPLWVKYTPKRDLISDTIFAIILIIFGYASKRIWIQSKINKFLHDDAVQESIEKQMEFDSEIKRFISPVLVKRIEEKTANGETLVMALDDVLMRKEAPVAVMFTDMRNFSTRSVDIDFVEHELVPSSSKIIDGAEDNMGIAKQIGDAVFVYYALEDPEEGLLRATKDSVKGCLGEKHRIKALGRTEPERFFSIAYGPALVGNMASFRHREATVIGSPANLSARLDSLTKEPAFKILIGDGNKVLVSKTAKEILKTFNEKFEFNEVNLEDMKLIMKSFPEEKTIYLLAVTEHNINALNEVLKVNNIQTIEATA